MVPQSRDELDVVIRECKQLATKRAIASAAIGATPLPGIDVATDITILINILPVINSKFGLSQDQINTYDEKFQIMILDVLKRIGATLAGQLITKQIIVAILKRMGLRITTRQVAKYVPVIGSVIAGAISFGAMKLVIHQHIKECSEAVNEMLDS